MAEKNDDVIEKCVGKIGKYQAVALILVLIGRFVGEFQIYNVVFILPKTDYVCFDDNVYNVTNACPCNIAKFDNSEIVSSVISEWNLICERTSLASLSQSIIQAGFIPGSVIGGFLSDRYGRKLTVCYSSLMISLFVSLSAVIPTFWMFLVIRFLIGGGIGANASCVYVYCIELTGASFRTFTNTINLSMDVLSYICITFMAYFVREWRYLQLAGSVPWILTVSYFWLLPESPRWQIAVGKTQKAIETLTNIAERNGSPTKNIKELVLHESHQQKESQKKSGSFIDVLKIPKFNLYIVLVSLLFLICGAVYFGISQYIGRLQGSLYLNTFFTALCLLPSIFIITFLTHFLKRKVSLPILFLTSSFSLLVFILTPSDYRYINLFSVILGLLGIFMAYSQVFLFTSEIFPTVVRTSAFAIATTLGRVGTFSAPFIVNIGVEWKTISIFMVLPILATMICFFLPETKGVVFIDTIEEFEGVTSERTQINNDNL